ncbi:MAG: MBL fold metallo-hydrolase [Methanolinea sp.]|jgi:hydroxyacylglutathione hydrolase|nr:MBL fold metallo-hydrolase [Methanolinea sp.]
MFLQKIQSEGLSHNSYFVADGGKAAVIDPRRDCQVYLDLASSTASRITHIFETHRNEDYVSGSRELAERTGAAVYHGAALDFSFGRPVREGDRFRIGRLELAILDTPGHTVESISIVLRDLSISDDPLMVFTGDALFAGDVGRTDLFGPKKAEWAAGTLYDALHEKILPLGDGVVIFPAHGAGSVCGGDIADLEYSTIGFERTHNPCFLLDREGFIARKKAEHHYRPPYFSVMEKVNRSGPPLLSHLPSPVPIDPQVLGEMMKAGAQILDTRSPEAFGGGHIPGSISLWRDGIPSFAGWVLSYDHPVVIVDDCPDGLDSAIRRLVRLGYDAIGGYLAGGFAAWARSGREIRRLETWSSAMLQKALEKERFILLDVRDRKNRETMGFIMGSRHIYVGEVLHRLAEIPRNQKVVIYCDSGFKGSLAASLLLAAGFENVVNILGGFSGWKAAGYPAERKNA